MFLRGRFGQGQAERALGDGHEIITFFLWLDVEWISMPRKSRIDATGALHHIICRGIELGQIFQDDIDREQFVNRLGKVLSDTSTHVTRGPCTAVAKKLSLTQPAASKAAE